MTDFDQEVSRIGSHANKYLGLDAQSDLIPLTVADMDFKAPECVTRALLERASHPIYGYTGYPESLYDALIAWVKKRHGWNLDREWILMSPGVIPSIHATILALTKTAEGVIIQPPVYYPFFQAIQINERRLIENHLKLDEQGYRIDFERLEKQAQDAGLLMLCSPHNPVGKVYTQDELTKLLEIARRYDLKIVSDEIHADLIYPNKRFYPMGALDQERVITSLSPGKTFNIPGLYLSALIVPNPESRMLIQKVFDTLHIGASNPFSIQAFETAYRQGEPWLNELLPYLESTKNWVSDYIKDHLPEIKLIQPEGTFVLWLDCRSLNMSDAALNEFFIQEAKVILIPGITFGKNGSGFVRMNIASPKHVIHKALERMHQALDRHRASARRLPLPS